MQSQQEVADAIDTVLAQAMHPEAMAAYLRRALASDGGTDTPAASSRSPLWALPEGELAARLEGKQESLQQAERRLREFDTALPDEARAELERLSGEMQGLATQLQVRISRSNPVASPLVGQFPRDMRGVLECCDGVQDAAVLRPADARDARESELREQQGALRDKAHELVATSASAAQARERGVLVAEVATLAAAVAELEEAQGLPLAERLQALLVGQVGSLQGIMRDEVAGMEARSAERLAAAKEDAEQAAKARVPSHLSCCLCCCQR